MSVNIIEGNNLESLRGMPTGFFQCCVTSPPYYGLRSYLPDGHSDKPLEIGLEPSPDEYVARMVDVFREVRRVLRDDGTLWLNIGDSYAMSTKGAGGQGKQQSNAGSVIADRSWRIPSGTKAKDLLGIPWQLAFALRQPYYNGRIKREIDRVWLAAMIDGEGCMFIHRRKAGTDSGARYTKADGTEVSYARTADTYGAGMEVANTSLAIIEKCIAITGVGSVVRQEKDRRQPLYRWNVRSNECRWIVHEVYPYLVAKQHQARLLLGCPSSGKAAEAAHGALIALHNGSTTHVDFPPPASLHEPGWFLRSDVIWAKSNPMPESVRDRPTSAHEHVFLLTKSARYFYDAAAIAEECESGPSDLRKMAEAKPRLGGKHKLLVDAMSKASGATNIGQKRSVGSPDGRNARNVWTIATQPYSGAHFATMPPDLAERCIKAGTSERGQCPHCGSPWIRQVERETRPNWTGGDGQKHDGTHYRPNPGGGVGNDRREAREVGWSPSCDCPEHQPVAQHVLDPFGGAGTTGLVADRLGRSATLCELNPEYARLARERITADGPLLAVVA